MVIALHYLKDPTGFPLDLASVFPYDANICTLIKLYNNHAHLWFSHSSSLEKNPWIRAALRMWSSHRYITTAVWMSGWGMMRAMSCINWHSLAALCNDHYCSSLYWAVATLTSTGYGNLSARSVSYLKRLYQILWIVEVHGLTAVGIAHDYHLGVM